MKRDFKSKDAKRRARKQQQKAIHAFGVAITAMRVVPDQRKKLRNRAERFDRKFECPLGG